MKKVKTSVVIDGELWERFKSRVGGEGGLRKLSRAVEEALEEELCENMVIEAIERLLGSEKPPLEVTPVRPKVATDAGRAVREMRESRL
ncbi:hypothetical protein IG193_00345 [Infirmifilum lucidum]|uniref:CopG family transcriptional regulator n=1 Tax=Infirmifilum lucidum TaxID=2776706 RepID=A0A7L9FH40_9CREN|nr:hypothetical protein [Infirmifilum lucidum]QOJ78951.1 hypothetical protein IG193_00345 [Infirmifilum lucidum]